MDRHTADGRGNGGRAEQIGGALNPQTRDDDIGYPLVERGHPVIEVLFGAAEAGVARLDGKALPQVPFQGGAGGEGGRPFAAELVEAVAFPGIVVVEAFGELARIEVCPPRALVMEPLAVGKQRPALAVDGRGAAVGQVSR